MSLNWTSFPNLKNISANNPILLQGYDDAVKSNSTYYLNLLTDKIQYFQSSSVTQYFYTIDNIRYLSVRIDDLEQDKYYNFNVGEDVGIITTPGSDYKMEYLKIKTIVNRGTYYLIVFDQLWDASTNDEFAFGSMYRRITYKIKPSLPNKFGQREFKVDISPSVRNLVNGKVDIVRFENLFPTNSSSLVGKGSLVGETSEYSKVVWVTCGIDEELRFDFEDNILINGNPISETISFKSTTPDTYSAFEVGDQITVEQDDYELEITATVYGSSFVDLLYPVGGYATLAEAENNVVYVDTDNAGIYIPNAPDSALNGRTTFVSSRSELFGSLYYNIIRVTRSVGIKPTDNTNYNIYYQYVKEYNGNTRVDSKSFDGTFYYITTDISFVRNTPAISGKITSSVGKKALQNTSRLFDDGRNVTGDGAGITAFTIYDWNVDRLMYNSMLNSNFGVVNWDYSEFRENDILAPNFTGRYVNNSSVRQPVGFCTSIKPRNFKTDGNYYPDSIFRNSSYYEYNYYLRPIEYYSSFTSGLEKKYYKAPLYLRINGFTWDNENDPSQTAYTKVREDYYDSNDNLLYSDTSNNLFLSNQLYNQIELNFGFRESGVYRFVPQITESVTPNFITNGDFENGISNWSTNGGGGAYLNNPSPSVTNIRIYTGGSANYVILYQSNIFQIGETYTISYEVTYVSTPLILKFVTDVGSQTGFVIDSSIGTHSFEYTHTGGDANFAIGTFTSNSEVGFDNLSVTQVSDLPSKVVLTPMYTNYWAEDDGFNFTSKFDEVESEPFVVNLDYKSFCNKILTNEDYPNNTPTVGSEIYDMFFKDDSGSYLTFPILNVEKSIKYDRKEYSKKNLNGYGSYGAVQSTADADRSIYSSDEIISLTLTTNWMDDREGVLVEQMFASTDVYFNDMEYIIYGKKNINASLNYKQANNNLYSVILEQDSLKVKKRLTDGLYNYEFKVKLAQIKNNK